MVVIHNYLQCLNFNKIIFCYLMSDLIKMLEKGWWTLSKLVPNFIQNYLSF